ncbi:MAG TPA: hypothetical protein VGK23_08695 [Methanomassiliicoccales archaeon]|jgi:hypothetical protein
MTITEKRVKGLEDRLAPNDEICVLIMYDHLALPKCTVRGVELTKGPDGMPLECNRCNVQDKKRIHILIHMV